MRLDLFLKTSRLVKRRPVANELCDAGQVLLNGAPVRAAHAVKPGDVIEVRGDRTIRRVQVLAVPESQLSRAAAASLYMLLSEAPNNLVELRPRTASDEAEADDEG